MEYLLPSAELVEEVHDIVLNPGELPGRARDKSLEGALARVENRLSYGMIEDVYALATAYAMAIAQGHCFNDANKRTAYRVMQVVLDWNGGIEPDVPEDVMGQQIIALAQGHIDDGQLAEWLRERA
ncbi:MULTISPECIES: type II toxin-antitoxin system death-on-curing family toxin [unclassified Paracoccus (in: a-proteobacteria)]|uniref:type II toxin-antitoxin system death-on-curing family toxin n=1 Tax=unclassified Paracoccus (in: a-proteobacteria) TaxID=2688777 RepID=UPI0016036009|nr:MULTISPECIES: type II toxin-antitoxin system death-on-curing family toxin [unclassified Paracoccus (in: a-proteobacteria)]MBB1490932.1 type II toxin-antitoxin system death-on-curing family toxin [Paracoccus sp. MC1854]MBB1497724.1 type II toxin-antitoxin system death-on-curing family toxin [Paracoccus sp. MC1862]QQO45215.1 type II toxin-antitoxin system death-on-curing family toxin [Paracoccus sp. MC1862]